MRNNRLFFTFRNIAWRFGVLLLTAIANLIIPRYVILIYGSEVNGLTSSIAHILAIVNLIQAGLASSVTYLMYQPIGEKNRVQLASIIVSARRIYRYISIAVLFVGAAASFVFAYVVKTELQRDFVLIASLLLCINSAASTYFTAVASVFLNAKQDGYLVSRMSIITNMIGYALQAIVLVFRLHFMLLFVVNMITCFVNICILSRCYKIQYEPFKPTEEENKQVHLIPIHGISYAAANEAAHAVINGSVTVIISVIAGLKASSVFSVYLIAVSALSTVSNAIYSAVVPSYGSVAAENNIGKTNMIFEIYQFILFSLNAFMYMCTAYLLIPFVRLYTSGVSDAEYINVALMILIVFYGLSSMIRMPYNNTVYIRGLFKQTYLQPVICAAISVVLMIVFTKIDYTYTLLGAIFFYLSNAIYQHFKIPKLFPGFDNSRFWNHLAVILVGVGIFIAMFFVHPVSPDSFLLWVVDGFITAFFALVILFIIILILDRKSLQNTVEYFKFRRKKKMEDQ